jgi:hypothetical protein
LRFVFQLLGANGSSPFVAWIYNMSTPLVAPFAGIFGQTTNPTAGAISGSVFEPATLVALIVYGLIAGLIVRLASGTRYHA